ncbi:hypothetical protein [Streptobacillus moniliformis]|uniref:hypothetical protein n=1 Tax=Streptobacillus moniliformis TaxID=34105 RepID=UPI0007E4A54E|nr:hypothetical protein [Streptobacillus moniliformis]
MKETIKEIDKQFETLFNKHKKFFSFIDVCTDSFESNGNLKNDFYLWGIIEDFIQEENKIIEELDVLITKLKMNNIE